MISTVIDRKIRDGFSQAALRYDRLTDLHREIGEQLISRVRKDKNFLTLLDVGMGTGWFTDRLAAIFPNTMVIGLDFAHGMVSCARRREGRFKIVEADAASLPFKERTFDVIASNLAYQWIGDLSQAFILCRSRLKEKGILHLTMFGYYTFRELFATLEACAGKKGDKNSFTIRRLMDKTQVEEALKSAGFRGVRVQSEHRKIYFRDMMHLIKWIKDIGANALPKDIYVGKDLLSRADQYYNARFKDSSGVYATFEVIWVEAGR